MSMTNEEVINALEKYKSRYTQCAADAEANEVIDKAIKALEREPCADAVSREEAAKVLRADPSFICTGDKAQAITDILSLPPVTPEKTTITYKDCSEAMMKMWIDNVITDGQYNKIMDKLNAKHIADMKGVSEWQKKS